VRFFARFALVALALFAGWSFVEPAYTATLVPPANWLMASGKLPLVFEHLDNHLLIIWRGPGCPDLHFELAGHELVYTNILAAGALLLTLPGWTLRSQVQWSLAVLVLLWGMHVLALCGGGLGALRDHLAQLPLEKRTGPCFANWGKGWGEWTALLTRAIGSWGVWGTAVLALLPWVISAWHFLGLDCHPPKR
jgi:hypothetical protein